MPPRTTRTRKTTGSIRPQAPSQVRRAHSSVRVPARPAADEPRPEARHDHDRDAVGGGQQQARDDSGDEQLADRLVRRDGVDDQHRARRDDHAEHRRAADHADIDLTPSEHDKLWSAPRRVWRAWVKAALATALESGSGRLRLKASLATAEPSKREWRMLADRGLAVWRPTGPKLARAVGGKHGRLFLDDLHAAAKGELSAKSALARAVGKDEEELRKKKRVSATNARRGRRARNGPILKSVRPEDGSNEKLKPWIADGVSRATWYRRRAALKAAAAAAPGETWRGETCRRETGRMACATPPPETGVETDRMPAAAYYYP